MQSFVSFTILLSKIYLRPCPRIEQNTTINAKQCVLSSDQRVSHRLPQMPHSSIYLLEFICLRQPSITQLDMWDETSGQSWVTNLMDRYPLI